MPLGFKDEVVQQHYVCEDLKKNFKLDKGETRACVCCQEGATCDKFCYVCKELVDKKKFKEFKTLKEVKELCPQSYVIYTKLKNKDTFSTSIASKLKKELASMQQRGQLRDQVKLGLAKLLVKKSPSEDQKRDGQKGGQEEKVGTIHT